MIVVSDTSPLTALLTVHRADLLATLFNEVVVPPAVQQEEIQPRISSRRKTEMAETGSKPFDNRAARF
jgi:predicted nucleic acid-binding protein